MWVRNGGFILTPSPIFYLPIPVPQYLCPVPHFASSIPHFPLFSIPRRPTTYLATLLAYRRRRLLTIKWSVYSLAWKKKTFYRWGLCAALDIYKLMTISSHHHSMFQGMEPPPSTTVLQIGRSVGGSLGASLLRASASVARTRRISEGLAQTTRYTRHRPTQWQVPVEQTWTLSAL